MKDTIILNILDYYINTFNLSLPTANTHNLSLTMANSFNLSSSDNTPIIRVHNNSTLSSSFTIRSSQSIILLLDNNVRDIICIFSQWKKYNDLSMDFTC